MRFQRSMNGSKIAGLYLSLWFGVHPVNHNLSMLEGTVRRPKFPDSHVQAEASVDGENASSL